MYRSILVIATFASAAFACSSAKPDSESPTSPADAGAGAAQELESPPPAASASPSADAAAPSAPADAAPPVPENTAAFLNAHGRIAYGCDYSWLQLQGIPTGTPGCQDGISCDELQYTEYPSLFISNTSVTFLGTCAEYSQELPIQQLGTSWYMSETCLSAPAICLKDADCLALRDCVLSYCQPSDSACVDSCFTNSEQGGVYNNFNASVQCLADVQWNDYLETLLGTMRESDIPSILRR